MRSGISVDLMLRPPAGVSAVPRAIDCGNGRAADDGVTVAARPYGREARPKVGPLARTGQQPVGEA